MDQQEEVIEDVIEEVEIIDYALIEYENRTLAEWQEELTVTMPSMPCSSIDIDTTCATLNNKYQIAYNAFNNLLVAYKELQSRCRNLLNKRVDDLLLGYPDKIKPPGRERLEAMARNKYKDLQRHEDRFVQISILKEYFEHHKNKLKDLMLLTNSLSYSANQSDRMFDKSYKTTGMR